MKEKLLNFQAKFQTNKGRSLWVDGFIFAAAMWLFGRVLIVAAMLLIAPLLPTPASLPNPPGCISPTTGWAVFSCWDSIAYQQIATSGYEYTHDGKGHNVAFFPLFPLFIRAVMTIGLPSEVAGTLVNNLAFLGAAIILYFWVEERHGRNAARWATAVLSLCPFSLFGTVIYSEGLFLLLSTATLRAFDKQQYAWLSLWGCLATATRPTGIALIPALAIASWRERRPPIAYAASLAASGGLLLYSLYCQIQFGDFLAFAHAQEGWKRSLGVDWLGWWKILVQITAGAANWKHGKIIDPLPPLLFAIICVFGYLLWRFRKKLGFVKTGDGFALLAIFFWLVAGDPLINAAMIFGAGYLLWRLRHQLSLIAVAYGFCGLGLILVSGSTISLGRLAYSIVSPTIALGVLLARYPRWGYLIMGWFAILLVSFAIRFAQHLWAG